MSRRQLALAGVALAVSVAVAVAAVVAASSGDGDGVAAGAPSTTSSAVPTTSTTVELQPVVPPAASTSTTDGSPAPVTTAPPPAVGSSGAVLRRPANPQTRTFDALEGCASLGDGPEYDIECGRLESGGVTLVWLTEEHRATGGIRAYVFRRLSGTEHVVALAMADDGPAGADTYASAATVVADVSGEGGPEIVFGFRLLGSGSILAVDLVESPGRVAAHLDLEQGSARVSQGQLDAWSAQFGPDDPNCCPSSFRHDVVAYRQGDWRIVLTEETSPERVPPSDL